MAKVTVLRTTNYVTADAKRAESLEKLFNEGYELLNTIITPPISSVLREGGEIIDTLVKNL